MYFTAWVFKSYEGIHSAQGNAKTELPVEPNRLTGIPVGVLMIVVLGLETSVANKIERTSSIPFVFHCSRAK